MIVMGVSENENGENPEGQIRTIFENQLELKDVGVSRCRRLGKKFNGRINPRPILVSFETVEKKMSVMKRHTKLGGLIPELAENHAGIMLKTNLWMF